MLTNQTYEKKKYVRMSDADHFRTFTNQNVLIVCVVLRGIEILLTVSIP